MCTSVTQACRPAPDHCTGHKGKCGEPYAREEVFEQKFTELPCGLHFDHEIMSWVRDALTQNHADEPQVPAAQRSEQRERSNKEWLPFVDTYRTLCFRPSAGFRELLADTGRLAPAQ